MPLRIAIAVMDAASSPGVPGPPVATVLEEWVSSLTADVAVMFSKHQKGEPML